MEINIKFTITDETVSNVIKSVKDLHNLDLSKSCALKLIKKVSLNNIKFTLDDIKNINISEINEMVKLSKNMKANFISMNDYLEYNK